MRIIIASAGPSVKRAGRFSGDFVLAVNRAAIDIPADQYIVGDVRTLRDIPTRRPLWTMKNEQPIPDDWTCIRRFDLLPGWADLPRPSNWSIQGAICVAVHYKATEIDIFGLDAYMRKPEGVADSSGYEGPDADRTPERWKRESSDLDLTIAWAQSHGATVTIRRT